MNRQTESSNSESRRKRRIRYAVVGIGHLAQVAVLPGFATAKNCELVTLVSEDPEKREKLGEKYGIKQNLFL